MFYYIFLQKNVDAILPGVMVSWFMPGLSSKGIILVGLPKLPVDFRDKKKIKLLFNSGLQCTAILVTFMLKFEWRK